MLCRKRAPLSPLRYAKQLGTVPTLTAEALIFAKDMQQRLAVHDQSSSASRVTAGALGFLILTQQSQLSAVKRTCR